MKITDIRATTVTVPLEAPLRHSNGAHWGRFVRTMVEVETDEGYRASARWAAAANRPRLAFEGLKTYLVGHDPLQLEAMRFEDLQSDRVALQQPHPAPRGDRIRLPRHHRQEPRRAGLRAARRQGARRGAVRQLHLLPLSRRATGAAARSRRTSWSPMPRAKARYGFTSHKLKGGRVPARLRAGDVPGAGAAFPGDGVPLRPELRLSVEEAIRFGLAIEDLKNDYFEDPAWGLNGMRRVREAVRIPTATNTVVVNFEQLAANIRDSSGRRDPARHHFLGRASGLRQGGRGLRDLPARHRACIPPASSASSSPACCISAPCCPTSASPPTPTTTTWSTT